MEKTLTESEKVEQLMRPRYKCIATYPRSDYEVGQIIHLTNHHSNEYYSRTEDGDVIEQESFYQKYRHIFRPLEWWQDRRLEDLPEYVKWEKQATEKGLIEKVLSWNLHGTTPYASVYSQVNSVRAEYFLPATSKEYNEYLTPSQAGER